MSVLLYVERHLAESRTSSLQALSLARRLAARPVHALTAGGTNGLADTGEHVSTLHVAEHEAFGSYAPAAIARATVEVVRDVGPAAVVAAGSAATRCSHTSRR